MKDFKKLLISLCSPRLREFGFEYHLNLERSDLIFGYQKSLDDGVHANILFQRQQVEEQVAGFGFTVELNRSLTRTPNEDSLYKVPLGCRLSQMIWFIYGQRIYPEDDYWWTSDINNDLANQIVDALEKIECYGIPWLEDPNSKNPWDIPDPQGEKFRKKVLSIIALHLDNYGYKINDYPDISIRHIPYFLKNYNGDENIFIEFVHYPLLNGSREFEFNVLLHRKRALYPSDYSHGYSIYMQIGRLLTEIGVKGYSPDHVWRYSTQEELIYQLKEAKDLLILHVIPWIESPGSQNPELGGS